MSKRQNVRRIQTPKLQGEGSFVEFKRFTYGESKAVRAANGEHGGDSEWEQAESTRLLGEHLISWSWVDDDGAPLPLPKDDPTVVDLLTDEELGFLMDLFKPETNPKV